MTDRDHDEQADQQTRLNDARRAARRALAVLTRPSRPRLAIDNSPWIEQADRCIRLPATQRITLPSLLGQLIAAVQSGRGGTAHGVQESKPPLDATSLSLLLEIAGTVGDACRQRRIHRSYDTAVDLAELVTAVNTEGDLDRIAACTRLIESWCARIRVTISNDIDRTWRMHGAACTVCSSTTVPVWDAEGNETRQPAMIVHSDDGRIDRVECGFCGTVLTGEDLTMLVQRTRRAVERGVDQAAG